MENTVDYWVRRTTEKYKDLQGYGGRLSQQELNRILVMHKLIGEAVSLNQAGLAICGTLLESSPDEFRDLHYLSLGEDVLISFQGLKDVDDKRIVETVKSNSLYKKTAGGKTDVYIPLVGKAEIKGQIKFPKNDACVIGSLNLNLPDSNGDTLYFEEIAADAGFRLHQGYMLRNQKRVKNLLAEAQERIAHDGRNAAVSMAAYLRLVLNRIPEDMPETRKLIEAGVEKCTYLKDFLTIEALSMSQLESEVMQKDPVNLSEILENVLRFYGSDIEQHGITLKKSAVKEAMTFGNEMQLTSVFANLVDNAIKYGDKKEIRVSIDDIGGKKYRTSVMSSGKGIKESDKHGIFEDYVKDESSEGLGLGLGNVANIVKMHHGKIEVDSDGQTYAQFNVILNKL